jgi:hypothetical protein
MPKVHAFQLEKDFVLERVLLWIVVLGTLLMLATPAFAGLIFSTGNPDGKIATASRPDSTGFIEIESADDFVLTKPTQIDSATFTGILTGLNPSIAQVVVEIYRVFPNDSDTSRTPNVNTRTNSPSDVEFVGRDSEVAGELSFTTTEVSPAFFVANSVLNGINPKPIQQTGGEGPISGQEVQFNVTFTQPIDLLPDHYFFVPQVLTGDPSANQFFWLSAPKPIAAPGTPFPPGPPDLQSWIRNGNLAPDWSRIGTDIVGPPASGGPAPTFNAAFSLSGEVPEPATLLLFGIGGLAIWWLLRRKS